MKARFIIILLIIMLLFVGCAMYKPMHFGEIRTMARTDIRGSWREDYFHLLRGEIQHVGSYEVHIHKESLNNNVTQLFFRGYNTFTGVEWDFRIPRNNIQRFNIRVDDEIITLTVSRDNYNSSFGPGTREGTSIFREIATFPIDRELQTKIETARYFAVEIRGGFHEFESTQLAQIKAFIRR